MLDYLRKGMTLYHKTNRTSAIILNFDDKNITIELSKEIANKKKLVLPITHVGEWLFYKECEVTLSVDVLGTMPQYLTYRNKKIVEGYNKNLERQKEKEIEEKERLLAIERQNELRKEEQQQLVKVAKLEYELKAEFISYLQFNYQFDGFYHYTDFDNYIKIMKLSKLLSRNEARKYGFVDAAEQSVIEKTHEKVKDYVRFYYKEKTPTIYKNEGIKADSATPHMPVPVILVSCIPELV